MAFKSKTFTRKLNRPDRSCIGVFGPEGSGKTRLLATAGEWAKDHGTIPGWIINDRKTRKTLKAACEELGMDLPYMNDGDFITQKQALELATNTDVDKVRRAYDAAMSELIAAAVELGDSEDINPILFDSGSQLWDWIGYSHFGRKQDVGKARVWGPPKQDWTDMFDALSHKDVIITLKAKDEWKSDARTGEFTWDGPPHLGYTTTSVVRLTMDQKKKLDVDAGESYVDRFNLDVVESQDNKALEGVNGVLSGASITYANLMSMLRPED